MGYYTEMIDDNLNKFRTFLIAIRKSDKLKRFLSDFACIWDDLTYRIYFKNKLAKIIYKLHSMDYTVSCVFCSNLVKSEDHKYSFTCLHKTYTGTAPLLPGTFSYSGSCPDIKDYSAIPWFFKAPCNYFKRLDSLNYFKNFKLLDSSLSTANYETIEGILFGITRGKRPCQICASVDAEIISECIKEEMSEKASPCSLVRGIIASHYKTI
jgi:hypothetical protein